MAIEEGFIGMEEGDIKKWKETMNKSLKERKTSSCTKIQRENSLSIEAGRVSTVIDHSSKVKTLTCSS